MKNFFAVLVLLFTTINAAMADFQPFGNVKAVANGDGQYVYGMAVGDVSRLLGLPDSVTYLVIEGQLGESFDRDRNFYAVTGAVAMPGAKYYGEGIAQSITVTVGEVNGDKFTATYLQAVTARGWNDQFGFPLYGEAHFEVGVSDMEEGDTDLSFKVFMGIAHGDHSLVFRGVNAAYDRHSQFEYSYEVVTDLELAVAYTSWADHLAPLPDFSFGLNYNF